MEQAEPPFQLPRQWTIIGLLSCAATIILGFLYARAQMAMPEGQVEDLALIVSVAASACVILVFAHAVAPPLNTMFLGFGHTEDRAKSAVRQIFGHPVVPIVGVIYAGIISIAAWHIDPWQNQDTLRTWLSVFLFAGNVIVGMGFCSIVIYWVLVLLSLPDLDLRILNLSRAPLLPFLRVNSRVVMITALITCFSILGVAYSRFELANQGIVTFSVFALSMAAMTYLVPIVPVSNLLRRKKAAELDRLERLIEAHIRRISGHPPRADDPATEDPLPDLDALTRAREIVEAVRTLPPGGQVSVSAAAIVAFLSFLPTIIDFFVSNVFLGGS